MMKSRYGLELAEYERIFANQGGACAICLAGPEDRRLAIDHDHATTAIRGLLCSNCNRGLGYLCDNPDVLLAAARYLERGEA